jgi:hypothetical protein
VDDGRWTTEVGTVDDGRWTMDEFGWVPSHQAGVKTD